MKNIYLIAYLMIFSFLTTSVYATEKNHKPERLKPICVTVNIATANYWDAYTLYTDCLTGKLLSQQKVLKAWSHTQISVVKGTSIWLGGETNVHIKADENDMRIDCGGTRFWGNGYCKKVG